jgi:protein-disulfide isomerase
MRIWRGLMLATAGLAMATAAHAAAPAADPSDMVRGKPTAPVTIIEYASVGCPHCAALHQEVFPAFKAKYIDTGKVRWVAREVLTGDPYLASGGFLLARCAGKDHYFDVTDAIYKDQGKISADLHNSLLAIAKSVGLTEDQFNTCLTDKQNLDAFDKRLNLADADGVRSTPTLMINGKVVAGGEVTLADLDKIVAAAGHKPGGKSAPGPHTPAAKPAPNKKS